MSKVYKEDGVDHIRIHLTANTKMGCELSEFFIRPFHLPKYAEFTTLIGLSLYLKTGCIHSKFRHLNPFVALKLAAKLKGVWMPQCETIYRKGIRASVLSDTALTEAVRASTMDFIVYNNTVGDLDNDPFRLIIADEVTELRKELKGY